MPTFGRNACATGTLSESPYCGPGYDLNGLLRLWNPHLALFGLKNSAVNGAIAEAAGFVSLREVESRSNARRIALETAPGECPWRYSAAQVWRLSHYR